MQADINFELFDKVLNEYDNNIDIDMKKNTCNHINIVCDNSYIKYCSDCGQEIEKNLSHDKEWRYYGQYDTKHNSNPNRVLARKLEDEKNIFKDVENMGFNNKIITLGNDIYLQVTKGQILRGNSRKSIIFASIFHAFKISGNPQPHDKLMKIFSLNKKNSLKGLKYVNLNAPKNSLIHTTYITPENLIEDIMDKFNASKNQKKEVIDIYLKIKNKSSKLNRSRPQSVASSVTYFWICKKNMDISLRDFAKRVELSELTIDKLVKEIELLYTN
jgi:transcription initiation factor TFIIIB Brf1 subunit/transcription initiation factor TFIIB